MDISKDIYAILDSIPEIQIADVGASDLGVQENYMTLVNEGYARLTGFEPNEEACRHLNEKNAETNCRFLPYFIGDGNEATFHETNWVATGSLYKPNTPLLDKFQKLSELMVPQATHQVQTQRMDDIPELTHVDYLKMDIQGSELAALSNGGNLLKTTLAVTVEVEFVELYENQPLFADVDQYLRSQGFVFHCFDGGLAGRAFKPFIIGGNDCRPIRQILWADAIYVRDWMKLDLLSEDQLKVYAVIARLLIRSPDLAHLVLEELDRRTGGDTAQRLMDLIMNKKKP